MLQRILLLTALFPLGTACATVAQEDACRVRVIHAMPRVPVAVETPKFWLERLGESSDVVLLSPQQIASLNKANRERPWAFQDVTSVAIGDQARTNQEIGEREAWLKQRLVSGRYKEAKPGSMEIATRVVHVATAVDELRVIAEQTDLRCIPSRDRLYAPASSPDFDRNQCSGLARGHLVRVLRRAGPWSYVHGGHSVGWVHEPNWTPPLKPPVASRFRDHDLRLVVTRTGAHLGKSQKGKLGESYPISDVTDSEDSEKILIPTREGLQTKTVFPSADLRRGPLPFTRRNVLNLAFSELNRGYGWGESEGLTDCSRLLLDTFRAFGIQLGRHSSEQGRSGTSVIDVEADGLDAKLRTIRRAAHGGVVFLYMPGHIMLYLGAYQERDYALSAIHSFRSPCANGDGEGEARIEKVVVSDLQVGAGTLKGSFLKRITKITVFGAKAGL